MTRKIKENQLLSERIFYFHRLNVLTPFSSLLSMGTSYAVYYGLLYCFYYGLLCRGLCCLYLFFSSSSGQTTAYSRFDAPPRQRWCAALCAKSPIKGLWEVILLVGEVLHIITVACLQISIVVYFFLNVDLTTDDQGLGRSMITQITMQLAISLGVVPLFVFQAVRDALLFTLIAPSSAPFQTLALFSYRY